MFAMAGALLATSCSNDELDTVQSGNEAQVTFSLGVEGGIGVKTRAISDGTGADKLVYAVFDKDGNRITTISKVERTNVNFPTTETLTLAKGQTYKVAFWAQDADCSAYTLDDNMNVTVDYADAANNDETRDAFFKTETFTVTGTASIDVVLKRPFAQINVGVTTEDWKAAVASGITINQSNVVVKNAATSLNLVTGAVSGSAEVTYNFATIPAEELKVDTDKDGNISASETYNWLSMSYILVNDGSVDGAQKTTLEGLEFTFKPESGNDITLKDGLTSVPVQRNWRTNILGKLLTGDITFNISIDPIYDGDYIYPDGSAQELIMAAANGGVITLEEDVVLQEPLYIAAGKSVVINLNGKTITPPANANRTIQVGDGAKLVIDGDGTIGSLEGGALAVSVLGGELTINGGTYYGGSECSCIYLFNSSRYEGVQNKGSIEINGGTFKVNSPWNNFYYVLNQQNSEGDKLQKGTIVVKGGTFENYDPAQGDDHEQPTNFVTEGYSSVKVSDNPATYQVVKGESISSVNDITTAINKAIENGSNTIYATEPLVFKENIELDGQGITLTGDPVRFEANATVKNLTFENASGEIGFQKKQSAVYVTSKSSTQKSLVFENCTFKDAYWDAIQITNPNLESISIKNCYFENNTQWPNNTVDGKNLNRRYIHLETNDLVNTTVEITGCTFVNVSSSYCNDSAITIYGYAWDNMTINNNTVKGDGADNLTTSIIWINDGVKDPYDLMSVDDIKTAFVYTAN